MKYFSALLVVLAISTGLGFVEDATIPNSEGHRILDWNMDLGPLGQSCAAQPGGGAFCCHIWERCMFDCANLPVEPQCIIMIGDVIFTVDCPQPCKNACDTLCPWGDCSQDGW